MKEWTGQLVSCPWLSIPFLPRPLWCHRIVDSSNALILERSQKLKIKNKKGLALHCFIGLYRQRPCVTDLALVLAFPTQTSFSSVKMLNFVFSPTSSPLVPLQHGKRDNRYFENTCTDKTPAVDEFFSYVPARTIPITSLSQIGKIPPKFPSAIILTHENSDAKINSCFDLFPAFCPAKESVPYRHRPAQD